MKLTRKGEEWRKTFNSKKGEKPNVLCNNCGYQNKQYWVEKSGICNGCGKVLDEKAYFIHEMRKKLHIVKGKQWREF